MSGTTRTRTRGSIRNATTVVQVTNSCSQYWATSPYSAGYVQRDPVIETITDVVHSKRDSYRNSIGDVSHSKIEITTPPIGDFIAKVGTCDPPFVNDYPGPDNIRTFMSGAWSTYFEEPSLPGVPGWSGDGSWCDSQLRKIAEAAPAEVSLPNFLLELGDVKSILPQIMELGNVFNRHGKGATLSSVLKGGAQAHLLNTFGIETLVRDVSSFVTAHERAVKRLNWLRRTNNQRVTVAKKRVGEYTIPPSWRDAQYPGLGGLIYVNTGTIDVKETQVVGAHVFQSYQGLDDKLAELSVLRGQLGFNRPFSVVYEAIPFTWLVDYFLNLNDLVESIKPLSSFQGTSHLSGPWFSKKIEYTVNARFVSSWNGCTADGRPAIRGKVTRYSRTGTVPSGYSPRLLSGPLSGAQITNLLAVLLQKGL